MASLPILVSGDDVKLLVTLRKDNVTFSIDVGADVKASLISVDHSTIILTPVTLSSATPGSDWSNSLVVVEFSSAETSNIINYGDALLETQVNDNGRTTFFSAITITVGTIA